MLTLIKARRSVSLDLNKNCYGENKMNNSFDYSTWKERSVIADCLREIGLNTCAKKALDFDTSHIIVGRFLDIIVQEAKAANRHDVLEHLYFSGLIYG